MTLTEEEWQSTPFPSELLSHAGRTRQHRLRLFACHCCRRLGALLTRESVRAALATAERFADEKAASEELVAGWREVRKALSQAPITTKWEWALNAVLHVTTERFDEYNLYAAAQNAAASLDGDWINPAGYDGREEALAKLTRPAEMLWQCSVLRDLFPWREPTLDPAWLRWQDGEIVRLAGAIRAEERWDHLPILCDALEEAGCTDEAILAHARSGGPHFKGCWLADGLLVLAGVLPQG